jgi:hypothetical protein
MEENNIEQKISLTYDTNAETTAKEVGTLTTAIDNTTQAQNENTVATDKNSQNLKSFKTQLREANQELLKVSQTFGETSKEAVQAAKKVADLKDQMGFAKDLVDNFNPDQKFKALGAATQIAATATSGLVSGMALFGDQSEDTEKAILKVQAAMAFSDAISGLSNLGDQWKTLKTVISGSTIVTAANTAATTVATAATKLFGVTANTTAVGFKVLRGAIIATGIGALGIAIVALVQNFDSIKKAILNTVPGLQGIADTIGTIVQTVTDFVGATSEADRQLDLAKSKAKQQLELNKKYLQEHESQLNEVTKKKIEAKNKYLEVVAEEGKATAEFARETNRQIAKADADAQAEKEKKAKEISDKAEEKRKEQRAKEKKEREDEAKRLEKERQDEMMASAKQALDIVTRLRESQESPAQKAEREYQEEKLVLENNNLSTEELTRIHLQNLAKITSDENAIKIAKEDAEWLKQQELTLEKNEYDKLVLTQKFDAEYLAAEGNAELQKQLKIKLNQDLADIDKETSDKEIENAKAVQDAKFQMAQDGLNLVSSISELFAGKSEKQAKKAFEIQKAVSLASAVMSGIEGTQNAYTTAQKSPIKAAIPAFPLIQAGLAAAFSVVKVAQISKQQFKGGASAGGGGATGGGGGGTSAMPAVGFQTSSENQIATTINSNQQEAPIVKAYVVSSDVSTAQAIDRNKVEANSLGGG